MQQILLQPGNVEDLRPEDLRDLADEISKLDQGYDVQFTYNDQVGHRVNVWEVLTIWLPIASDGVTVAVPLAATIAAVVKLVINWANKRFKEEEKEQIEESIENGDEDLVIQYRPKSVDIVDANGNVLKSIVIHNPNQEPEDHTAEHSKQPHRRPSIRNQ